MKILILFTGGTIGSSTKDGVTAPDPETMSTLLKAAFPADSTGPFSPVIVSKTPYFILSEHLGAENLNLLTAEISENLNMDFDGILITHGSDTIRYTAAALNLMFPAAPVPILLICSNFPLSDPHANGMANFRAAVSFLQQCPDNPGIFVPYRNASASADAPVFIHRGCDLLSHAEASGDLSGAYGPYAVYEDGIIHKKEGNDPSLRHLPALPAGRTLLCRTSGILQLSCAPGCAYPMPGKETNAVILLPYHCGTLPVSDPSLAGFCAFCRNRGIPIYTPTAGNETHYASLDAFTSLGITAVPVPAVTLYLYLWILISRNLSLPE